MTSEIVILDDVGVSFSTGRNLFNRSSEQVLTKLSFSIHRGESIGVLGRNGAGKSTLLKLIAGIINPDVGNIWKADVSCALLNLQIGFDLELSGFDNIYLLGILLGCDHQTITKNLDQIINFSELGNAIQRPVKTYSAGMKARLGFSVAMELRTDILLIDEVMGVGDINFREKSTKALRSKILSEQTVVLVSHHADTVKNLCDRAIWIEKGIVQLVGNAAEVVDAYEKYVSES